jgi:molecular chaperone GrpE
MMSEAASEIEMNLNNEGTSSEPAVEATVATDTVVVEDNVASASGAEEADTASAKSEMAKEIETLRASVEERNNQYMRIAADFENFRKRSQKEKEELEQQVKRNTITELLPVVDNFERARAHLKPQTDAEMAIHKSYQGVYKQLVDSLKRMGVSAMRPEGKEFDPNLHEAVMRQPTDEHPEGTVLEELVRGYYLGDRVLRHAMVKVAAAPETGPDSENSTPADS